MDQEEIQFTLIAATKSETHYCDAITTQEHVWQIGFYDEHCLMTAETEARGQEDCKRQGGNDLEVNDNCL